MGGKRTRMKEPHIQKCMNIQTDEDVLRAMECTDQLAEDLGFMPTDQLLLRLVTEEAIVNARTYSIQDQQNQIRIYWCILKKDMIISVKQLGAFFTINKQEEINYGLDGRGLQLIVNIMDEVWIEQEPVNYVILHMKKSVN